jgi:hypothetical protein
VGWAIELRKDTIQTPTRLTCAEGNMSRDVSASPGSVRRSRRPQNTPRNFIRENRETSETPAVELGSRSAGEGSGHTARVYVCEESHCGIVPMNHSNKDGTSSAESEEGRLRIKENAGQSNTCPTQSGEACVSQGLTGVRTSGLLCFGRYSSEIRTGCANERPSGSVRGAPGDWCPYRDQQLSKVSDRVRP